MLDRQEIEAILPHREPFLMLDRVTELVPGEYAIAEKDILATDDVFRGHFPGHPVFPGVLQLEALAQTGAVAVLSQPEARGQDRPFRQGRRRAFQARRSCPATPFVWRCASPRAGAPWARAKGKAFVGSDLVCSGTLTFAIAEP